MINDITSTLELVLLLILFGFWMFAIGCAYQNTKNREQNKVYDMEVYKNRKLVRENKYLRKKLGLDNLGDVQNYEGFNR